MSSTVPIKTSTRIGLIGAGKMATALVQGMIQSGFSQPEQMIAADALEAARSTFQQQTGINVVSSNLDVIRVSELIILAVKPQVLPAVLAEVAPQAHSGQLYVSIVAGVPLATLQKALPECRHIRVMPNTPALVQAGAAGFSPGEQATDDDAKLVEALLSTVGRAVQVPESQLDAVTGLSGSGPAYVFEMIEALSDGGVLMGLPRQTATLLAAQTMLGAAQMVLETEQHPGVLKDAVTSPGGTTIAGLHQLECGGLRGILMSAVQAATEKSQQLGR